MSSPVPDETLLGLLAVQPQHGYQLLEQFHDPGQLGAVWKLSTSQLYAVLKRLERLAWINGCQIESENAPPRIEYTLTPLGQEHLFNWLNEADPSASIRRVRVEFLSRLYVARLLHLPTHEIVQRQRHTCQHELGKLLKQRGQTEPDVAVLAQELVIAQLEAVLGWINQCEMLAFHPN